MSMQPHPTPAPRRHQDLSHHLKLVKYRPPGGSAQVCAAIWSEGGHVHLSSPLLRSRHGVLDPQPYARQFPEAFASIDAFEETMSWFDAACFAATDPREVERSCEQHPEWRLRCERYDGGNQVLLALGRLIRAAEAADPLPEPLLRDCALEMIRRVLKAEPQLAGAQLESTLHDGDEVAVLELGVESRILVLLVRNVPSTDIVRQGLLAHRRMAGQAHRCSRCLLVSADLPIAKPMFLSPRVAIVSLDPDQLRTALLHMAGG